MAEKKEKHARKRNAQGTRAAILASARQAFAAAGYDGAGLREIAAGAGVTAMMVGRYFGSKEKLFAEVVADAMAAPVIAAPDVLGSGAEIARALVRITDPATEPLDGFRISVQSAANARATEIGREQIERHHLRTVAQTLSGPLAQERAAILLSLVAGVQMMRQTTRLSALTEADPSDLTAILAPLFQSLVEAPA